MKHTQDSMPFRKQHYLLMVLGILLIAAGFIVMNLDEAIYGFWGTTFAPMMIIAGYALEFFCFFYSPKTHKGK